MSSGKRSDFNRFQVNVGTLPMHHSKRRGHGSETDMTCIPKTLLILKTMHDPNCLISLGSLAEGYVFGHAGLFSINCSMSLVLVCSLLACGPMLQAGMLYGSYTGDIYIYIHTYIRATPPSLVPTKSKLQVAKQT